MNRKDAFELLLIEEADAWFEYLAATRAQTAARYGEVEISIVDKGIAPDLERLRAIRTRRTKLRPAAAA